MQAAHLRLFFMFEMNAFPLSFNFTACHEDCVHLTQWQSVPPASSSPSKGTDFSFCCRRGIRGPMFFSVTAGNFFQSKAFFPHRKVGSLLRVMILIAAPGPLSLGPTVLHRPPEFNRSFFLYQHGAMGHVMLRLFLRGRFPSLRESPPPKRAKRMPSLPSFFFELHTRTTMKR